MEERRRNPRLEELLLLPPRAGGDPAEEAASRWKAADPATRERARRGAERLRAMGVRAWLRGDALYPASLLELPDPPAALYLRGRDLPGAVRAAAVVGTRAATEYGVHVAAILGRGLARADIAVVSGLARGIDAAAHQGALEAGGHTVAVLPAGIDTAVPGHHAALAREIAERGTLVSEWSTGAPVSRSAFPERNRLIAALSGVTVVVEAPERSGALITADWARRLRRGLLAVPGDVDREASRGCLKLLRAGAAVCAAPADVIGLLHEAAPRQAAPQGAGRARPGAGPSLPAEQLRVFEVLVARGRTAGEVARRARLAPGAALRILLELQLLGLARELPGQRFARSGDGT